MTVAEALDRLGALPLKRYCELTGESANTVYQRIHKGFWKEGEQYAKPISTGVWVLLSGANAWLTGRGEVEINLSQRLKEILQAEEN